jgi:hypothetical protein
MRDEKKMTRLKQIIIEAFMDSNILETIKRLDPITLDTKANTVAPMDLAGQIQADIDKLTIQFDRHRISAADRCYTMVASLEQFVNFNFLALFKKFDSHFIEGSFTIEYKFPSIKTILIINELSEFLAVTQPLKPEDDWKNLMNLLKICNGQGLVNTEEFTALIKDLREIHTTKVLELIIQYTLKNPVWHWKPKTLNEQIGEEWLEMKKAEAARYIGQINNAQINNQISTLAKQVFDSVNLTRLSCYNVQAGEIYRKKGLEGFLYAEGLNYLKAYLEDYFEGEIKDLCDILIIRGQWANKELSKEMSESLHKLLQVSAPVTALDDGLSEYGADGSRLRAALLRVERDKTQVRYINSITGNCNDQALELINDAAQDFIVIGKHLKSLIDDIQKKRPELLINWKELNQASRDPLAQRMVNDYKKMNYFIQLLKLCTQ